MRNDCFAISNNTALIPNDINCNWVSFFEGKNSLKNAVAAFKKNNNTGISVFHQNRLEGKDKLIISIHSKNGTGQAIYNFDSCSGELVLKSLVRAEIDEYFGANAIRSNPSRRSFKAVYDPILSDLVYGQAVMHTNIDDSKLLFKEFALFSCPFSVKKYEAVKQILGYNPIIEFSAINKRGFEMDFITLNDKLEKFAPYGYFAMKTPWFREKVEILRKRFTSGKIKFIVTKKEFQYQKLGEEDWKDVEFIII